MNNTIYIATGVLAMRCERSDIPCREVLAKRFHSIRGCSAYCVCPNFRWCHWYTGLTNCLLRVNSRRFNTDMTRDESDFGTFGLRASQHHSMRFPARLERFHVPRSEGEVIGISSWQLPADVEIKDTIGTQDGDYVMSRV